LVYNSLNPVFPQKSSRQIKRFSFFGTHWKRPNNINCKYNQGGNNMSDLAATGCGTSCNSGFGGNNCLLLILLLCCCGGDGGFGGGDGCGCDSILWIIILLCCCGGGFGGGSGCGCGC